MKKDIFEMIEIPQEIGVEIAGNMIIVKKNGKEIKRKFDSEIMSVKKDEKSIIIEAKKARKKEKKLVNTLKAHIKNMLQGLKENFVYKLKVCSVHFPMGVSVEKNNLVIKNFLGENKPRKAKITDNVNVKVEKDIIIVESFDKEAAGQTAANIEKTTKVKAHDKRIFQDGIFLISRNDEEI